MKIEYSKNTISKDKSPTTLIKSLLSATPSCRKAINFIIKFSCHYKNIYPSQEFIGQQTGVCRQTANEALKKAEELGFLESTYYHRQTKSYRIAFFFSNPYIRSALLGLLPALSLLPIYGCLSSFSKKDDTNINNKNIYINSFISYTKNSASDDEILKKREIQRQEELKRERLTTNVNKIFNNSDYAEDIYEAKNHKREVSISMANEAAAKSQPQSTKKLFPKALLGRAKDIWELAQNNRITLFRAKRDLARCRNDFPEGIPLFTEWYNSAEGLQFRKWINT